MIRLYRVIMYLTLCLIYPVIRVKAARGHETWRGRLVLDDAGSPVDLWLHAASVGEVRVVGHLVEFLRRRKPGLAIHVTVMTRAGAQTARQIFAPDIAVSFLPLDLPHLMERKLRSLAPRVLVIAETEIWPNLITAAAARRLPMVQVNGRMSEKAFQRYTWVRGSLTRLLAAYERFFLKGSDDAARFAQFGVTGERVVVAGDMKFDAPVARRSEPERASLRQSLGVTADQFLVVAGSTRPGEEQAILDSLDAIRGDQPGLRLVVAPRHLDRIPEITDLIVAKGFTPLLHSAMAGASQVACGKPLDVILVDRMGLLAELYAAADLAFVGGTLTPLGGHNILEPVWAGTPVLFGPSLDNVRDAAEYIVSGNYGAQISAETIGPVIVEVARGRRSFRQKTESDIEQTATSMAGEYLLKRLSHA